MWVGGKGGPRLLRLAARHADGWNAVWRCAPQAYADRVAVSYPELSTGAVARYLGLLAAAMGRRADAAQHFERAVELNRRIEAWPWLERTERDRARVLPADPVV